MSNRKHPRRSAGALCSSKGFGTSSTHSPAPVKKAQQKIVEEAEAPFAPAYEELSTDVPDQKRVQVTIDQKSVEQLLREAVQKYPQTKRAKARGNPALGRVLTARQLSDARFAALEYMVLESGKVVYAGLGLADCDMGVMDDTFTIDDQQLKNQLQQIGRQPFVFTMTFKAVQAKGVAKTGDGSATSSGAEQES